MKTTHVSSITAVFNGQRGGHDLTIRHLPDGASDTVEEQSHHHGVQGVEEAIRNFRLKYKL